MKEKRYAMEKPVLLVLAAGMGSRYGGLKQIDPVGGHGQSILDYSVYDARRAGFETVIFLIKRELEADFRRTVGERTGKRMEVRYAFQQLDDLPAGCTVPEGRVKPWGTAQAVLAARDQLRGPFAVINADDYYGPGAFAAMYRFLSAGDRGPVRHGMLGYLLGNTVSEYGSVSRGVCRVGPGGLLEEIVERRKLEKDGDGARFSPDGGETWERLPGETVVSMNFWGFRPSILEEIREQFPGLLAAMEDPARDEVCLPDVIAPLIREGKAQVEVLPCREKWYGVTYREDKPSVEAAIRVKTAMGLYPEDLWGI